MSGRSRGGGRGAYYKEKYGVGGRGGRTAGSKRRPDDDDAPPGDFGRRQSGPRPAAELAAVLQQVDGKQYPAYHDIEGVWSFDGYQLMIDRTQADPYAAPTRMSVRLTPQTASIPTSLRSSAIRLVAVADYLSRRFGGVIAASGGDVRKQAGGWGGEKGGEMAVDMPGQHVLQRTSVEVSPDGSLEARFTVALPAKGRTVLGRWASAVLVQNLPGYVAQGLTFPRQDATALQRHVECVEDSEALRGMLSGRGLVAFVANGSVLPRASGASDLPLHGAVPFHSPPSLQLEIDLPNAGAVRGMGLRKGITLIVGGGYHGKSTLLAALDVGVYNKVPGDGRELVATDPTAVKIRAEDGRRVASVNISPFLRNLPLGRDTRNFSTDDASGSTSQASNIQEALEMGSRCLLLDEDLCATNMMFRDARMQALVEEDPICPFSQKILPLAQLGVSCVLVSGASSDFFAAAGTVIRMQDFEARDVTAEARAVCRRLPSPSDAAQEGAFGDVTPRAPLSLLSQDGQPKIAARTKASIQMGDETIDIAAVEQLVEHSQTRAIASALGLLHRRLDQAEQPQPLSRHIDSLMQQIAQQGLSVLAPGKGDLALPRPYELAAALNRLRSLRMKQLPA